MRVPKPSSVHTVSSILDAFIVYLAWAARNGVELVVPPPSAGAAAAGGGGEEGMGASASSSSTPSAAAAAAAAVSAPSADAGGEGAKAAAAMSVDEEGGGASAAALPATASASSSSSSSSSSSAAASAPPMPSFVTPMAVAAAVSAHLTPPLPAAVRAAKEICDGLRSYFDRCLHIFLLYRFERPQYESVAAERPDEIATPSGLYGAEHLLRLIVKLPELLNLAGMTPEETEVVVATVNDLMRFLTRYAGTFFTTDHYVKATPAYAAAFEAASMSASRSSAAAKGKAAAGGAGGASTA